MNRLLVALLLLGWAAPLLAQECLSFSDCSSCTSNDKCIWCEGSSQCLSGDPTGPDNDEECPGDWKWKQCVADGQTLVWVILGVGGGILLIAAAMIWYCCHKRSKKKERVLLEDYERQFDENPRKSKATSSQWEEKKQMMRAKYGIQAPEEE